MSELESHMQFWSEALLPMALKRNLKTVLSTEARDNSVSTSWPGRLLGGRAHKDFAAHLLGGFSLLVLAR